MVDDDVVRYELYGFIYFRLQHSFIVLLFRRAIPLLDCVHHCTYELLADTQVQVIGRLYSEDVFRFGGVIEVG